MREGLAALQGRRVRFSGTFRGVSPQGHVILSNVRGPVGDRYKHLWIPSHEWQTFLPLPGKHVELVALVDIYQRDSDNSVDFGLFNCVEVLG